MSTDVITRAEFSEFTRRIDDENTRQNQRIAACEQSETRIQSLTVSVEKMVICMNQMVEELKQQGKRLTVIENRDGEMWRKVVGYVLTALASSVMTFIFTRIGR